MEMKISVIVAIVIIAVVASLGVYYYGVMNKQKTTSLSPSLYPGYVSTDKINNIFGGTWLIISNVSGYISINHNNNTIKISFVNGTTVENPASNYPNIYSNSFYNYTILESVTEYYQKSNSSNMLAIEVVEANVSGEPLLNQDIQSIASLYGYSINSMGNISYVQAGNSIIAIYKNYLILLASTQNYGNKMLILLNETTKTFK
ncbi:MAG: hypothetical protein ACP5L0_01900 [Caldisphaera sp.]|uniref:hypothetical protein n=1 Tax=Caldisphaera sp. TaxID=2060322 RepID=UPI003D0F2ACC